MRVLAVIALGSVLVGVGCGTQTPKGVQITAAAKEGEASTVVLGELNKAKREGRQLLVYVGAAWCEPCRRFHQAAAEHKLDADFPTLRLLEFDSDRDGERLAAAGYVSQLIPLFARPREDGRASGRQIEGSVKGDGAVVEIVPRLRSLLGP